MLEHTKSQNNVFVSGMYNSWRVNYTSIRRYLSAVGIWCWYKFNLLLQLQKIGKQFFQTVNKNNVSHVIYCVFNFLTFYFLVLVEIITFKVHVIWTENIGQTQQLKTFKKARHEFILAAVLNTQVLWGVMLCRLVDLPKPLMIEVNLEVLGSSIPKE